MYALVRAVTALYPFQTEVIQSQILFKMQRFHIVLVSSVCVIVLCLYSNNLLTIFYKEMQTYRITKVKTNTGRLSSNAKPKVLILTSMKSGSSFLGQLFATNPDIFYLFEPLHSYGPAKSDQIINELKASAQSYGFNCVGTPTYCRLNYLYSCQILHFLKEAMFVNPQKTRKMYKWNERIFGNVEQRKNMNGDNTELDYLCSKTYKIIVIKTIRIDHIEEVVPLIQDGVRVSTVQSQ